MDVSEFVDNYRALLRRADRVTRGVLLTMAIDSWVEVEDADAPLTGDRRALFANAMRDVRESLRRGSLVRHASTVQSATAPQKSGER